MKWIGNLYRIFTKSINSNESWVLETTSLRQADFDFLRKKQGVKEVYDSDPKDMRISDKLNGVCSKSKFQSKETFPSVLNRIDKKTKSLRIKSSRKH